jgi:hypothetical protein
VSQQELICQGGIQINTATVNATGTESVSVDLPNGPKSGTIWAVDVVGLLFTDSLQTDDFPTQLCGIYVVPVGTPPPDGVDTVDSIAISSRGTPLAATTGATTLGQGLITTIFGQLVQPGPFFIPSGYTIRAVLSTGTGTVFNGNIQLSLFAQLRILNQQ